MSQEAPRRPGLMSLEDALSRLLGAAEPLPGQEQLSTLEADGRVLAQDIRSALDVPGFSATTPEPRRAALTSAVRLLDRSATRTPGRSRSHAEWLGTERRK